MTDKIVKDVKFNSVIAGKGMRWTFNAPYAPHFGDAFEIMIKAAKRAVTAILGNADITDKVNDSLHWSRSFNHLQTIDILPIC